MWACGHHHSVCSYCIYVVYVSVWVTRDGLICAEAVQTRGQTVNGIDRCLSSAKSWHQMSGQIHTLVYIFCNQVCVDVTHSLYEFSVIIFRQNDCVAVCVYRLGCWFFICWMKEKVLSITQHGAVFWCLIHVQTQNLLFQLDFLDCISPLKPPAGLFLVWISIRTAKVIIILSQSQFGGVQ